MESAIPESLDAGTIEVKSSEILPANESVAGELGQVVSIKVELSGIHWDSVRKIVHQ